MAGSLGRLLLFGDRYRFYPSPPGGEGTQIGYRTTRVLRGEVLIAKTSLTGPITLLPDHAWRNHDVEKIVEFLLCLVLRQSLVVAIHDVQSRANTMSAKGETPDGMPKRKPPRIQTFEVA